jgi:hypothetical protein
MATGQLSNWTNCTEPYLSLGASGKNTVVQILWGLQNKIRNIIHNGKKAHIPDILVNLCIGGLHYSHGRVGCVRATSSSDQTAQSKQQKQNNEREWIIGQNKIETLHESANWLH